MKGKFVTKLIALSLATATVLSGSIATTAFAEELTEDVIIEDAAETEEVITEDADTDVAVEEEATTETAEEAVVAEEEVVEEAASTIVTLTDASQVADLVWDGYNAGAAGPISIIQGTYTKGKTTKDIYLVTLSGTEDVKGQSTGYLTDLLSGFNLKNAYYDNVVSTITANIPKNATLILAGHSLGGMIAQQVAADKTIKNNYDVMNTVTYGSPLLSAGSREGTVKRLGDTSDVVPYLSGSLFNNTLWAVLGLNRENGGYGTSVVAAHCESYLRSDVWGAYDVTGTKKGGASLTLDLSTRVFYQSPAYL